MELKRIAIDTSKWGFTLNGVDAQDRPVLRRDLRRGQLVAFFAKPAPSEVVLEACGGSHHWPRTLSKLGHRVGLIPPQYVKRRWYKMGETNKKLSWTGLTRPSVAMAAQCRGWPGKPGHAVR